MSKKIKRGNLGASPGTLQYVGPAIESRTRITKIEFNADFQRQSAVRHSGDCLAAVQPGVNTWLNVDGLHQPELIGAIGKEYGLHPLLLEDILNTLQKPKFDFFGDNVLFLVLKWLEYNPYTREVEPEHVALVLGPTWLLSFQEERDRDIFEVIRKRIEAGAGKTRQNGTDYLLYAITDLVVDQYFRVLDAIGENLEELEEALFRDAQQKHVSQIYTVKRELTIMRKTVAPLREILLAMAREAPRSASTLISPTTEIYLRDLYDHVNQVNETVEIYREQMTGLLELYNSTMSNRLNNVMKVLTIISVIFMPLTFVAGIYGMNFEFMPELHWTYGYPFAIGLMACMVIGMLLWFRWKKWL
ncbi:magnesium/cobalt transporter CorA [Siphonobacter aquaeclarae]|jgi:magnesium transporter|uniref:Magnesium transport protein CorA n=1 Tax=Siphonobacter aquaeclarae TaxID=563176 RepID=A0A1G9SXF8_9BACT|nr:magnesium/cobalt transporter CorA [Siphonobacter aquaeclarae]SDM40109.1 magnesium transporter [Siphonobacter aquaeclarae]